MSTELVKAGSAMTLSEMRTAADAVVKSRFFGVKSNEEALTLMMLAQAEGMHPVQAMRQYHVIQGRPAMRADAMLAKFQQNGGKVKWGKRTDSEVSATFSHEIGGEVTVEWTTERAKTAGLLGNGTWQKFPRQMLTARVISEGVRTVLPGVVVGIYTPEEVESFDAPRVTVVPVEPDAHTPHTDDVPVVDVAAEPDPLADDAAFKEWVDEAFVARGFTPDDADNAVMAALNKAKLGGLEEIKGERRGKFIDAIKAGKFDTFKTPAQPVEA